MNKSNFVVHLCQSDEFREHTVRFMQAVGVVVEHIDNYELRMSDLLRERKRERELIFHIATTLEQAHNRNTKLGGLPERHLAHQSWPPIERDLLRELGRRHHTTSHLSICLPVCPSVRPFVHSFIRLFISLFVYLFIHSFSYLHLYGTHEARRHHSIARKRNLHFQVKRYSRKR